VDGLICGVILGGLIHGGCFEPMKVRDCGWYYVIQGQKVRSTVGVGTIEKDPALPLTYLYTRLYVDLENPLSVWPIIRNYFIA
jgi:hypothetical protein